MINEILFKKAVAGDGDSFYKLLEPIKDTLYRVAITYVGNEHDALDCLQESIIKAIKALRRLKDPQHFNTWIMRITINSCKDFIKKNKRIVMMDIKDYEDIIPAKDNWNNNEDILLALNKLKLEERDLIVMRYLDDMSLKDISENTNVPVGTVKSKVSRTLKKLRIHMEEV